MCPCTRVCVPTHSHVRNVRVTVHPFFHPSMNRSALKCQGAEEVDDKGFTEFVKMARRTVHAHLRFSILDDTPLAIDTELKKSSFLNNLSTPSCETTGTSILFVWDQPCAGEADCNPHLRNPPFRYATCNACITGALQARCADPADLTCTQNDIFLFADGGKSGLHPRFRKTLWDGPAKSSNKELLTGNQTVLSIGCEQNNLQTRSHTIRGYLPRIESVLLMGLHVRKLPTKTAPDLHTCVLGYERHTSGACQNPGARRVVGPVVRQQEGHLRVFPSEGWRANT